MSSNVSGVQDWRDEPAGLCAWSSTFVPVRQGADSFLGTGRMGFLKQAQQLALPSLAPFSPLLSVPCGRVNPLSTPSLTGTAEGGNPQAQGWGSGGHPGVRFPPPARVPAAVPACLKCGVGERR